MTHDRVADAPAYGETCYDPRSNIAKLIQPLDMDVLTAAKERIGHLLDTFDTLAVSFSGGKDSLAVLNLVSEVYAERGIRQKVKVFFRDEELIPDAVIDFVQGIYASGKYDFAYYAIPLKSEKFVLGRKYDYVQFDPSRKWLRQPPPYAIRLPEGDRRVFDQYSADEFICARYRGRVAVVNGIRAQESLIRFRSCVNKKNDNYINATKCPRVKFAKPIYDWSEDDIFKYFCRRHIQYCPIYDAQTWNNEPLRVSTPLHAEAAKRFGKLKTLYPKYYEGLITLFPEMLAQARYYSSLSADAEFSQYPHTFDGLLQYVEAKIDEPRIRALAKRKVVRAWGTRLDCERRGMKNLGGYSLRHLFKAVQTGAYKREILPAPVGASDFAFEGLPVPDDPSAITRRR